MRLLYAEDEPAMSEAAVDILTYHKYIVEPVYDGQSALDYALSGQYDGIILDIMMPVLSGLEVLQKLRSAGCQTPVGPNPGPGPWRRRLSSQALPYGVAFSQGTRPSPAQGRVYSKPAKLR